MNKEDQQQVPRQTNLQQSGSSQVKEEQSGIPNYSTVMAPPLVGQQSKENVPEKEATDAQK